MLLIEIYKTVNNLNPSFKAEVFVTIVVPYDIRGSTNLGHTCMALILSGLLVKDYGRVCRKKLKNPKH